MPLTWKDRIKVAVASGGTGTLTLGSAASGYRTFAAGDDAKLFPYVIENGTAWETGYGTYTHSGTTFARTTRTDSSSGSAIDAGTGNLYVDLVSNNADNMNLAAQAITPGGRLTLESGVPVSTTDQTGKTNVYYTPYVHNIINLWDGNVWKTVTFSEVTQALGTLTSGKPYDVFGYLSSGALATELLVWTNDTTRATAITLQDGRYCKSGDKTRLYLGSLYTTATTTTEDSAQKRLLYNHYNRVRRTIKYEYGTAGSSWAYNTNTWRAINNDTSTPGRVQVMCGMSGEVRMLLQACTMTVLSVGNGNAYGHAGICINNTNANNADARARFGSAVASLVLQVPAGSSLATACPTGFTYYQQTEYSDTTGTGTVTYYNADTTASRYTTGLHGILDG